MQAKAPARAPFKYNIPKIRSLVKEYASMKRTDFPWEKRDSVRARDLICSKLNHEWVHNRTAGVVHMGNNKLWQFEKKYLKPLAIEVSTNPYTPSAENFSFVTLTEPLF